MEIDGPALVEAAGSERALNAGMLGALAALEILPFDGETLWRAVEQGSGVRFVESNRRAFVLGGEAARREELAQ